MLAALLLAAALLSCSLFPGALPPPAPAPAEAIPSPTPPLTETPAPGVEPLLPASPTPVAVASTTPPPPTAEPCRDDVCLLPFLALFDRPSAPPARDFVDVSYPFGDSQKGKRDTHHGVEFLNSTGTPVLAAAPGEVIVAGDDEEIVYGLYPNFYGDMVVLQHELPGVAQPLFTLYAHLSQISVRRGERVEAGQLLGEVGSSGAAIGSHLHFEVRFGENAYDAARNPALWLRPRLDDSGQMMGALAGIILDAQGKPLHTPNIVVQSLAGGAYPPRYYTAVYDEPKLRGLEPYRESFALGELPAGQYKVSFVIGVTHQRQVEIQPGILTFVTIRLEE